MKMRLASLFAAAVCLGQVQGATLTWDSSGTSATAPVSGAGTWNTSNTDWSNGVSNVSWNNANGDIASFGGTGYTVTLGTPITAGGLEYTGTSGITITSSTITLTGSATITAAANNGLILTIGSVLSGTSGMTRVGQGQVSITTQANYTGTTTFAAGSGNVRVGVDNALPTATFLVNNGGLLMTGHSQTVAGLSGNGSIRNTTSGTTATMTVNGTGTSTFAGTIFDSGTAASVGLTVTGGYTLTLTGASNTYNGATTISSAGTLILNSNISNSRSVTITSGTLSSSAGNKNLGAGLVSMSSGLINISGTSVGSFTLAANQNLLTTGGTIRFDLGTTSDSIIGSGTGSFSLSNTTLALAPGTGFSYANTYTLFNGFTSGAISNLTISGYDAVNYTAALSNAGVLSFTAIPEPATIGLAGAGVLILLGRRRLGR